MSTTLLKHPLIQHKLSILRDQATGTKEFREIVGELAALMCFEATRDLPVEEIEVQTPLALAKATALAGKKLAIVPILRAGLGMLDGLLQLIPAAKVAHLGLYRDPKTLTPVEYFCKLPPDVAERLCIIIDPMLATGGTAVMTADLLKSHGVRAIKMLTILSAPEGVAAMEKEHPDVEIYTCAIDDKLNDNGYIVPGLGDAGDRIFGTK